MTRQSDARAAWLTLRVFTPSPASLAGCVLLGVAALILHITAIGVRQGAVLGNFLDGQWSAVYDEYFRGPLNNFLALTTLNSALEIVLWGIIGLVVYTLAERFARSYGDWRDASRDVQLIAPGQVVRHPLSEPFYAILAWRVVMTTLLLIWLIFALTMLRQLVGVENLAFNQVDTEHFNSYLLSVVIQWIVLGHALVVLLRLAARRARLLRGHGGTTGTGFFQD